MEKNLGMESKHYLVMVNHVNMSLLSKLLPGLMFVEVEGKDMDNLDGYKVLVNPNIIPNEV